MDLKIAKNYKPLNSVTILFFIFFASDRCWCGQTDLIMQHRDADNFSFETCNLKCQREESSVQRKCLINCFANYTKPAQCPGKNATISQFEKLCVNSCKSDIDCSGVLKCCQHECGNTCMTPIYLHLVPGLPPLPTNISVEIDKSNIFSEGFPITIRWNTPNDTEDVKYIIQVTHAFKENGFDDNSQIWVVREETYDNSVTITNFGRPGLWYQFRVIAINVNGTLGPSLPSTPVQLLPSSEEIKPTSPQDFTTGAISWGNGTLRLQLVWKKPASVLPIIRYKVSWYRRKNDSMVQYHNYLPKNMYHYWLRDVEPRTEYYFSVNAIAKYGRKKLKGNSSSIVFTTPDRQPPKVRRKIKGAERNIKYKKPIESVRVRKMYWWHDQLFAKVTWEAVSDSAISYHVTWSHRTCCEKCKGWYIGKTDFNSFEIYDLQPDCDYKISVKAILNQTLFVGNTSLPTIRCDIKFLSDSISGEIIQCPLRNT